MKAPRWEGRQGPSSVLSWMLLLLDVLLHEAQRCPADGAREAVYVEDLRVAGLGRTRLAKSVHDAGWASFTGMLEYKAARYGRTFARVDRFFPSTRMCSDCGRVNDKMALDIRTWNCPCGSHHDRDINAARNVRAAGQADLNDRGAHVRPGLFPARREAVTHPDAARSTRSVEGISVP